MAFLLLGCQFGSRVFALPSNLPRPRAAATPPGRSLSLRSRIQLCLGAALVFLVALSAASVLTIGELASADQWVSHTSEVIAALESLGSSLKDAQRGERNFVITGDPLFLAPVDSAREEVPDSLRLIRALTADNSAQQTALTDLTRTIENLLAEVHETVDIRRRDGFEAASARVSEEEGHALFNLALDQIGHMQGLEEKLRETRRETSHSRVAAARLATGLGGGCALLVVFGAGQWLLRDTRRREKAEQTLQLRYAVTHALMGDEPAELVLARVVESVCAVQGWAAARVWRREERGATLVHAWRCEAGKLTPDTAGTFSACEEKLASACLHQTELLWLSDLQTDCQPSAAGGRPLSTMVLALLQNGEAAGLLLQLVSLAAIPRDPATEQILRSIAAHTGLFLHNRESQAALQRSEERFRELFEKAGDLIQGVDEHGRFAFVNASWLRTLGYERAELAALQLEEVLHSPGETPGLLRQPGTFAATLRARDGRLIYVEGDTHLQEREDSGAVAMSLLRDVTRKRQLDEEMLRAREVAEAATRAKSSFLAMMSHEIRTPMNGVLGLTGLLLDTALTAEQRHLALATRDSAEALLTVINDILDFSRIEAGRMVFEEMDFDVRELLESTLEMLSAGARAKSLELAGVIEPGVPPGLRGDPTRLRQVLTNLVGNAVKFTAAGSVSVRVSSAGSAGEETRLSFCVEDTGIGIPEQVQGALFEPFVQADGSTSRTFGGTGLGLAICRQLVEHMGGEIAVRSQPGAGAAFTFTVQLRRGQAAEPREPELGSRLLSARVLVVEDNAVSLQALQSHLAHWKLSVEAAGSGAQALARLAAAGAEEAPYSLVLLDMLLPDMDGLTLARAILSQAGPTPPRMVLLQSWGEMPAAEQLARCGVAMCRYKPLRQSALYNCLTEVLDGRPREAERPPVPTAEPARHGQRLLLVDDSMVNQRVALGQLKKLGYEADTAANGAEALAALERRSYPVVLMDCQMPVLDGYAATAEIRRREGAARHTWIIALTAHSMIGDREQCVAAGMDDYLSKPTRSQELAAALSRVPAEAFAEELAPRG